jgi:hypothetical protein
MPGLFRRSACQSSPAGIVHPPMPASCKDRNKAVAGLLPPKTVDAALLGSEAGAGCKQSHCVTVSSKASCSGLPRGRPPSNSRTAARSVEVGLPVGLHPSAVLASRAEERQDLRLECAELFTTRSLRASARAVYDKPRAPRRHRYPAARRSRRRAPALTVRSSSVGGGALQH